MCDGKGFIGHDRIVNKGTVDIKIYSPFSFAHIFFIS
nr:MAG TPA: hypothetical protein [Caudoviricetes sp.]